MKCRNAVRMLSRRCDDDLPEPEFQALQAHLDSCGSCRQQAEEFQNLGDGLRRLLDAVPASSPALRAAAQWRSEKAATRERVGTGPGFRRIVAFGSACLLIAAVGGALVRSRFAAPVNSARISKADGAHSDTPSRIIPVQPSRRHPTTSFVQAHSSEPAVPSTAPERGANTGIEMPAPLATQVPRARPIRQDDLAYVNADTAETAALWRHVPASEMDALAARLQKSVRDGDDFVKVPFPYLASLQDKQAVNTATETYKKEAAIVDARLLHKVTLACKGISFTELCRMLRDETGIAFTANRSVADDNLTVFCTEMPLRDLMRRINRLFGFTWFRDGEEGAYRYELAQDLKSRLLEEEMRNRDRNEALLALDREMQRYRKYLPLAPADARKQAEYADPDEKKLLDTIGGSGWGPIHLYFELSSDELVALQNGQSFSASSAAETGQRLLTSEQRRHALESAGDYKIEVRPTGFTFGNAGSVQAGKPLSDYADMVQVDIGLKLNGQEQGQYTLDGNWGFTLHSPQGFNGGSGVGSKLAVGMSPSIQNPDNETLNAKWKNDPAMRRQVDMEPAAGGMLFPRSNGAASGPRVASGDVLEALHKASGMDVIGDSYLRVYEPTDFAFRQMPLFDVLNKSSDRLHMHWNRQEAWLEFRTTSYFEDRLKEVPRRLLKQWSAHRAAGASSLEDLIEISQLPAAQLGSNYVAEAVRALYGLQEWEWTRSPNIRNHWAFLAGLNATQRKQVQSAEGLPFTRMGPLQPQFVALIFDGMPNKDASLRAIENEPEGNTISVLIPPQPTDPGTPHNDDRDIKFIFNYGTQAIGRFKRTVEPYRSQTNSRKATDRS